MKDTQVGTLIDSNAQRDAIHCAIAPVQVDSTYSPGTHVGLVNGIAISTIKKTKT